MSGVRFAPSPTGRFHLGNLRTAWISIEWAKRLSLAWVVRFEDIDRPRVLEGAQDLQLQDMAALGLIPDVVLLQSDFNERHWALFERGVALGRIYPCYCSRKEVQTALHASASAPHGEPGFEYSGKCRARVDIPDRLPSTLGWRFRAEDPSGRGDFIVARTNPLQASPGKPERGSFVPSYQWACAIDDFDGGYELIVRASDLRSAVETQQIIQRWIAETEKKPLRYPAVFHSSLIVQNDGHRLEKRTRGVTLEELLASGWTSTKILERFHSSFDSGLFSRPIRPGELIDEPHAQLPLSELGF